MSSSKLHRIWRGKIKLPDEDNPAKVKELRDVQVWAEEKRVLGLGQALEALYFVDPYKIPVWRFSGRSYRVFSQSSHTKKFFKALAKSNGPPQALGKLGLIVQPMKDHDKSEDNKSNKPTNHYLIYVEPAIFSAFDTRQAFKLCMVPICIDNSCFPSIKLEPDAPPIIIPFDRPQHGNDHDHKKPIASSTSSSASAASRGKTLLDQMSFRSRSSTPFEVAAKNKQHHPTMAIPGLRKSEDPSPEPHSRTKEKIHRVVLSALRLRDVQKDSAEYRQLLNHTYRGVLFALRRELSHGDVSVDKIQDKAEALLNLFA
uniref:Mitochondrial morphogenesis protein SLD7 n=1 Tax=Blastobotrys adeninivorans TaxID=409370 RepID=A0A060T2W3_BLAAD